MAKSKYDVETRKLNQKLEKEAKYNAAHKKLLPLPWIALGILVVSLLLYFLSWTEIYNVDIPGPEIKVGGWSYALVSLTREFQSPSTTYGDLQIFYYFADSYCETLAMLTLASVLAAVLALVLEVITTLSKKLAFNIATAVLALAHGGLLIGCYAVAISMNDSRILPEYCSGNPACSVRSYAVLPAIVAIVAAAFCAFIFVKDMQTKKLLK